MEHRYEIERSDLCILLSVLTHTVTLCLIFLSFVPSHITKDTLKKAVPTIKHEEPEALPAPIVLYSGSITPSRTSKMQTQHSPAHQTPSVHPHQKNAPQKGSKQNPPPSAEPTQEQCTQKTIQDRKKDRIISAHYRGPLILDDTAHETQQQKTTELIEHKEPKKVAENRDEKQKQEVPELFKAAHSEIKEGGAQDVRKRPLTLADLFKTMPHLMNKLSEQADQGDQLVVVQGDMKYYSFLKQFLAHINQVFAFHGGPHELLELARNGRITQNAAMSVVIDRQGNVLSRSLRNSFGCQQADELVLKAVDLSSPFPPVPQHFKQKTIRVELVSVIH